MSEFKLEDYITRDQVAFSLGFVTCAGLAAVKPHYGFLCAIGSFIILGQEDSRAIIKGAVVGVFAVTAVYPFAHTIAGVIGEVAEAMFENGMTDMFFI